MRKKTYIGTTAEGERAYISWELKDGKFSASGEIWEKSGADMAGGGQNIDEIARLFPENDQAQRIHEVWKHWHLNDMCAGSPKQMELIEGGISQRYAEYKKAANEKAAEYRAAQIRVDSAIKKAAASMSDLRLEMFRRHILENHTISKDGKGFQNFSLKKVKDIWVPVKCYLRSQASLPFTIKIADLDTLKSFVKQQILSYYDFVCQELEKVGRLVDPDFIHNGRAYRYGSAWLKKDLPPEVVDEINSWQEVKCEELTPIQILCKEFDTKLVYLNFTHDRHNFVLDIGGEKFPYFAGSAHKPAKVKAEDALAAVLSDAEYGKDGYLAAEENAKDLGYETLAEIRRVAAGVTDTYDKLSANGVWDRYQELMGGEEDE